MFPFTEKTPANTVPAGSAPIPETPSGASESAKISELNRSTAGVPLAVAEQKRGRGRPPGSGTKTSVPMGQPQSSALGGLPPAAIDPKFFAATVGAIISCVDAVSYGKVYRLALKAHFPEIDAKEMAVDQKFTPEENKLICETASTLAMQYPQLAKYGPLIGLCGAMAGNGMRRYTAISQIKAELKKLEEAKKKPTGGVPDNVTAMPQSAVMS